MPETGVADTRVVLIGPTHPAPGGIVHFTEGLASALEARAPTHVIGWTRRFPEFLYPGTSRDEESTIIVSAEGEPILDLMSPASWSRAVDRCREFGATHVVLQWWHPLHMPVIRFLSKRLRRLGIETFVVCHNVEPHETNRLWRTCTRSALSQPDHLIVHSSSLASEAEALVPNASIIVAFMPVFDNVAQQAGDADMDAVRSLRARLDATKRPLLLAFGYVRPYKGIADAIDALPHSAVDPVLLIAGECWDEADSYREQARLSPRSERIHLEFRYVPNDEIPILFTAADAVLLPYRQATQSAVAALAFAYNRPVIATDVGGLPDLVKEGSTGALSPPENPVELGAAIDRVLVADHDWSTAIGSVRQSFSWSRYVDLILHQSSLTNGPLPPIRDPSTHAVLDVQSRVEKAEKVVAILRARSDLNGVSIVDIGTGNGTIARVLATEAGPTGSVVSLDVSDVRVDRDGYQFLRYDGHSLPLRDGSADIVISNHVIEHVGDAADQRQHLSEIARILRPGGIAYIAVPHRWQFIENHYRIPFLGWIPRRLADTVVRRLGRADHFDIRALDRRELARFMTDAGLQTTDVTSELINVSVDRDTSRGARLIRSLPILRRFVIGPLVPTIVMLGRKD